MKTRALYLSICAIIGVLLIIALPVQADNEDILSRKINLPKSKGTIYELLEKVTERSGCLFIYDSRVIKNEQTVNVKKGEYTIRQAIYEITGNRNLSLRVIGNHILIELPAGSYKPQQEAVAPKDTVSTHFTIEGSLFDRFSNEPIPFASVGLPAEGIGTITNMNGDFRLRLPDSLGQATIQFSHIGYLPQFMDVSTLMGRPNTLSLEPKVISLQEVVVRLVNPQRLIREMLDSRKTNYNREPVYLTSFYREGVEHKKGIVNLTEAVFKIYKAPYDHEYSKDQVKLLKMRQISNEEEKDTLIAKMKSGINASLMLDLVKNLPEFLLEEYTYLYNYAHTDITVIDNRLVNVITFEQKKEVKTPLYRGEIFIDSENNALLSVQFEIHPKYVEKAAGMFVERKSRALDIKPQQISYTVSYKQWNNKYYVNHVRGDLHFRIKKKKKLWGSVNLHTWFEMVTCKIDTTDVSRFTRNEALQTRTIFADTNFSYDATFWEDFNVILPEEKLSESINKITAKIEETGF
ncbi:hypothetical protein M2459_003508 [Parabacteroides sp. PF5-5]|uniref:carboxypeptidase-like regulatory domain-containing protein n=1 Tax=unclassified Parabacteroides TaxID=2649774 RepID=UPI002476935C|nr:MULTISPECIES: carboxypeptidase-like regulatory domain-containing protein [unclassified Parabacteroides]MDH6305774.1 hypothetical protein [Parabacteroides sp. PH5-39]MDH6317789.1 hypothetical protein [Parabacteroides sp. PF5-13]MDH6320620.1 hypothetical protein [Parabacteroides sp. PH5-13]MDH6324217.1 hypothetical protein [Parabacteroides sp. PH5-8]MDH6328974.1 hypothetical protein [Parabacteroides sp. PH5-41]